MQQQGVVHTEVHTEVHTGATRTACHRDPTEFRSHCTVEKHRCVTTQTRHAEGEAPCAVRHVHHTDAARGARGGSALVQAQAVRLGLEHQKPLLRRECSRANGLEPARERESDAVAGLVGHGVDDAAHAVRAEGEEVRRVQSREGRVGALAALSAVIRFGVAQATEPARRAHREVAVLPHLAPSLRVLEAEVGRAQPGPDGQTPDGEASLAKIVVSDDSLGEAVRPRAPVGGSTTRDARRSEAIAQRHLDPAALTVDGDEQVGRLVGGVSEDRERGKRAHREGIVARQRRVVHQHQDVARSAPLLAAERAGRLVSGEPAGVALGRGTDEEQQNEKKTHVLKCVLMTEGRDTTLETRLPATSAELLRARTR